METVQNLSVSIGCSIVCVDRILEMEGNPGGSIWRSLERATEAVNAYYQVDWEPVEYVRAGGISTEQTALLAAAVLISCLLVIGFLQKRGKICLTVLLALGFLSPFLVGQVPEDRTVWELFAAVMGLLAMQTALPGKRGQVRFSGAANGVLVGTAALAFAGGTFIVEPFLQTIFPPDSPKQKLALEELWQDIRKDKWGEWKCRSCKGRRRKRRFICGRPSGTGKRAAAESDSIGKTTEQSVFVWIYWYGLQWKTVGKSWSAVQETSLADEKNWRSGKGILITGCVKEKKK